ncbi:MAG: hypothetical protein GC160_07375 [Acidobacteria bacterium]|nr:hypothetical protein [Acidobacteriota bacterium]
MTLKSSMMRIFLVGVAALATTTLSAMEPYSKKDLDPKNLARLEENATTPHDWREIARMYEARAKMLFEKAERHDRLQQRYAAAPKSLIAKRGHGWNTPKRQAELAAQAREEATEARRVAESYMARADGSAARRSGAAETGGDGSSL